MMQKEKNLCEKEAVQRENLPGGDGSVREAGGEPAFCSCGTEREKRYDRRKDYERQDMDNKLIWNLRDIGRMIRSLSEGKESQSRILILLRDSGKITQSELTERLGIQPGSASEVIGKLENAGLIVRTPSERDRRTADIQLTGIGEEKAQEAARQRKQRHTEMFCCLTEEEKQVLLRFLEKIKGDWRYRYDGKLDGHGRPPRKG